MGNSTCASLKDSNEQHSKGKLYIRARSFHNSQNNFYFKGIAENYNTEHLILKESGVVYCDFETHSVFFSKTEISGKINSRFSKISIDVRNVRMVDLNKGKHLSNRIWQLLSPKVAVELKIGDVLNFGSNFFRFAAQHQLQSLRNSFKLRDLLGAKIVQEVGSNGPELECRICCCSSPENKDMYPLCKCFRSNPYHLECMRRQLALLCPFKARSEDAFEFKIDKAVCELCNTSFPGFVNEQPLFNVSLDLTKNFLIFEELSDIGETTGGLSVLYYPSTEKKVFKVGRTEESELCVVSPYSSVNHASIEIKDHTVNLIDESSSYGTGIFREFAKLQGHNPVHFFIGSFLFSVTDSLKAYKHAFLGRTPGKILPMKMASHEVLQVLYAEAENKEMKKEMKPQSALLNQMTILPFPTFRESQIRNVIPGPRIDEPPSQVPVLTEVSSSDEDIQRFQTEGAELNLNTNKKHQLNFQFSTLPSEAKHKPQRLQTEVEHFDSFKPTIWESLNVNQKMSPIKLSLPTEPSTSQPSKISVKWQAIKSKVLSKKNTFKIFTSPIAKDNESSRVTENTGFFSLKNTPVSETKGVKTGMSRPFDKVFVNRTSTSN